MTGLLPGCICSERDIFAALSEAYDDNLPKKNDPYYLWKEKINSTTFETY